MVRERGRFYSFVSVLGNHSLLVFVIHAYLAYAFKCVNGIYGSTMAIYPFLIVSLLIMYESGRLREKYGRKEFVSAKRTEEGTRAAIE